MSALCGSPNVDSIYALYSIVNFTDASSWISKVWSITVKYSVTKDSSIAIFSSSVKESDCAVISFPMA